MTYSLIAVMADADPVTEAGDAPSDHAPTAAKLILAHFLATHPTLRWADLTLTFTRTP